MATGPRISVMVVDDHPVMRAGLSALFDTEADIDVVATAGTTAAAVASARERRPDVACHRQSIVRRGVTEDAGAGTRVMHDVAAACGIAHAPVERRTDGRRLGGRAEKGTEGHMIGAGGQRALCQGQFVVAGGTQQALRPERRPRCRQVAIVAPQMRTVGADLQRQCHIVIDDQSRAVSMTQRAQCLRLFGTLARVGHDPAARRFFFNLAIAFMPLAVLGLAFGKLIKAHLFKPVPVALAFIVGAFVILWAERRHHRVRVDSVDDMRWSDALKVGCAQAFALIPGTSRSGATIIGGLLFGLSRKAATEFSFFLAVPTLMAAGAWDFWKNRALFAAGDIPHFAVGIVTSFVAAFLCIRWLIRYVASHDFTPFAWYRIAFGALVLCTAWSGMVRWSAG